MGMPNDGSRIVILVINFGLIDGHLFLSLITIVLAGVWFLRPVANLVILSPHPLAKSFMQPINELDIWHDCCLLVGEDLILYFSVQTLCWGKRNFLHSAVIEHLLMCLGILDTTESKAWLFLSRNHYLFIILVILKSDVLAECMHNYLTQNSIYKVL